MEINNAHTLRQTTNAKAVVVIVYNGTNDFHWSWAFDKEELGLIPTLIGLLHTTALSLSSIIMRSGGTLTTEPAKTGQTIN